MKYFEKFPIQSVTLITQELNLEFFIESPPLALIFAECLWKDWVNLEYPNKYRTGREWELRQEAAKFGDKSKAKPKKAYYKEHVCGKVPEAAMFVDAVTVEDQIPWYELKYRNDQYETYKLTPQ